MVVGEGKLLRAGCQQEWNWWGDEGDVWFEEGISTVFRQRSGGGDDKKATGALGWIPKDGMMLALSSKADECAVF